MFKKDKKQEKRQEMLEEFAKVVAYILTEVQEKELDCAYKIGKQAHKEFFEEEISNKKPKLRVYEINAKDKEDAIRQIRRLELDEKVENSIIKAIKKN